MKTIAWLNVNNSVQCLVVHTTLRYRHLYNPQIHLRIKRVELSGEWRILINILCKLYSSL